MTTSPTGRTIAIGDIHGCAAALDAVLDALAPTADDRIIPLGDYVDRGPHSREVVDRLLDLSQTCRVEPLLGNHEVMLLSVLRDPTHAAHWLACGGAATVASYGGALTRIPDRHCEFFAACRRVVESEGHFFVHANYHPREPLDAQPDLALFWEHITRRFPAPHASGKKAVVGHTPQHAGEVFDAGHLVCIDTYCFGGGWLTALDVATGQTWQANRTGTPRPKLRRGGPSRG